MIKVCEGIFNISEIKYICVSNDNKIVVMLNDDSVFTSRRVFDGIESAYSEIKDIYCDIKYMNRVEMD